MATDITGYRSDGGALGQDQQVSQQLQKILTSKYPLLSSPGSVIENSLYYDVTSSSVSAVEMQATFAKDRIVMSNMQMGSAPSAYIPSQLFADTVFWVAQIPNINYAVVPALNPVPTNAGASRFYAPLGWGFNALQSVIVYMGASSIAQIEIDWFANLMVAIACCETEEKVDEMLRYAGMLMDNYAVDTVMWPLPANGIIPGQNNAGAISIFMANSGSTPTILANNWALNGGQTLGEEALYLPMTTCCVPIRLPFTSMCVLEKKLSLDTKLLTQPIQITLQTKAPNAMFIVGNQLDPQPTSWSNSTLQLWQEELSDKSLSVRNDLLAAPEFNVGYPFQYAQSMPFTFPNSDQGLGNVTYNGNAFNQQQITMNVTSIINSDLTTMLFMVTNGLRNSPVNFPLTGVGNPPPVVGNGGQFAPLFGEELSNITLLLNGQRFFSFDQGIYAGVSLAKNLRKISYRYPIPHKNGNGTYISNYQQNIANNTVFGFEDSYIYELNFSRLRAIIAESHLQNTARFTNQTFQLTFNVQRARNYVIGVNQSKDSYVAAMKQGCVVHMCYLYNGVFLIGGDGGTTKLVTN